MALLEVIILFIDLWLDIVYVVLGAEIGNLIILLAFERVLKFVAAIMSAKC